MPDVRVGVAPHSCVSAPVACGFDDAGGNVVIRRDHPTLALVPDNIVIDTIVFSGNPTLVARIEKR